MYVNQQTSVVSNICLLIVKLAVIRLRVEDAKALQLRSHDEATILGEPRGKNMGSRFSNTSADLSLARHFCVASTQHLSLHFVCVTSIAT